MRRAVLIATALAVTASTARAQGGAEQSSRTAVERRTESLLSQMTLEEKIDMLGGTRGFFIRALPRLGLPELRAADSPFGVRTDGPSTLYAGGIALAATFDPELARRIGTEIGRDARARGVQYHLGPGVNLYRSPLNGRNFEYYGEDPFLAARTAVGFIEGVQSRHVSSTIKHFLGNNSEYGRHTTNDRIDERTLREIYMPAYEAAVKEAHTGSVMGSYNLVNGQFMTENRHLIEDVVKGQWGFDGVYMSDWSAVYNALAAANGGTDVEMPAPVHFNRDSLLPAVQQGTVSPATIDDKVRRLIRNAVRFGWMDHGLKDDTIPNYNAEGARAALDAAREGIVLLKNAGILPLDRKRVRSIAVIGPNAVGGPIMGGGSALIPTYHKVDVLDGIASHVAAGAHVEYHRGVASLAAIVAGTRFTTAASDGRPGINVEVFHGAEPAGTPAVTRVDEHVAVGVPFDLTASIRDDWPIRARGYIGPSGPVAHRFSGYYQAATTGTFDFLVQQAGFAESGFRLFVDDKLVRDRWTVSPSVLETIALPLTAGTHKVVLEEHSENDNFGSPFIHMGIVHEGAWVDSAAVAAAKRADVVVLAVGYDFQTETEGWDRSFTLPPGQDDLIQAVVAANPRTIVVVNSGGGYDMSRWAERVPALLQAWYAGQEGGTAVADILFGDVNPSGHLPITIEKRWEDNPTYGSYYPDSGMSSRGTITYKEGVFVGYRGYERNHVTPRFPFGFGLSYTTFRFSNLSVAPVKGASDRWVASLDVTNTGKRAGAAVPQLYVHQAKAPLPRPAKELKGFARVMLAPGQTKRVSIPLDLRSLAYYAVSGGQWQADAGTYDIMVGSSSADIALHAPLELRTTITAKP